MEPKYYICPACKLGILAELDNVWSQCTYCKLVLPSPKIYKTMFKRKFRRTKLLAAPNGLVPVTKNMFVR